MRSFNKEQLQAINHGAGPALVIAGPGSGKTAVLTTRIKTLIEEKGINPKEILVITFSKAAGLEMEERFQALCDNYYPVNFGTFHSIFFHIICETYRFSPGNVLTNKEKRDFLKKSLHYLGMTNITEPELLDSILKNISYYKNSNEKFYHSDTNIEEEDFVKIYREYKNICSNMNKIDFDDMMLVVYKLFKDNKEVLEKYRNRYTYILVDECQDINFVQYKIVEMLGGKTANIFMVGDDDQSIYGFRGADVNLLKSFLDTYKNASYIRLSVNYRCCGSVIKNAMTLINENKNRFVKDIRAGRNVEGETNIKSFESSSEEDKYMIALAGEMAKKNQLTDMAVICRTNKELSYYGTVLKQAGLPVTMKEIPFNPYKTREFKAFYHYMRMAENPGIFRLEDLFAVMNTPVRYMSRNIISTAAVDNCISIQALKNLYRDKSYMKKILDNLLYDLKTMNTMDIYCKINYIRKSIGYDEFVLKEGKGKSYYDSYMENAAMIMKLVKDTGSLVELEKQIILFEQDLEKKDMEKTKAGINLCTYHSSKGLEFDTVLLPHVNEGTVPNKNSSKDSEVEEERRMFYVAMTRAKNRLVITYVEGKKDRVLPSRFLGKLVKKK